MESRKEFDYVVVGAGSAGCVVAARLSESGKYQVALLEAGGADKGFWFRAPLGMGKLYDNPDFNWMYETEPEPGLDDAKIFVPRGKVLGGTGSINGMVYTRGQKEDFETWRQMGNDGWGYDEVLPYFKKSEDNERGADAYHSVGGPLGVSDPPRHELVDAFIDAGIAAGYPRNNDFNGAEEEGFGYNQLNTRRGARCSTAAGFLKPALKRANLTVITNALASKVVFDNGRATSVEFRKDGAVQTVTARREIVLCLGAANSPQLLQVSGVGPADLLRDIGVPVVTNLAGVGENLQDHFGPAMTYRCTKPVTLGDRVNNPLRKTLMGLNYLLFRKGMMRTNGSFGAGSIKTRPELTSSDIRLKLNLWGRSVTGRSTANMGLLPFSAFSVLIALQHPDSRGTIRAKSADAGTAPEIRYNFFLSEKDQSTCVEAVRIVRRIMALSPVSDYVQEELVPGPKCDSYEEILEFCRKRGRATSHLSGTCKMGIDEMSVVDPRLRVRGVSNLRVVDASVMPRIVGSNPNAAIIMIGEKGADMILQDAGRA